MSSIGLLRFATAIAPRSTRERMAEEWSADLAGCAEFGLSPADVLVGALLASVVARARDFGHVPQSVQHAASVVWLGLLLGAVSAVGDVSVLVLVLIPAVVHAPTVVSSIRWHGRAPRPQPRRAG